MLWRAVLLSSHMHTCQTGLDFELCCSLHTNRAVHYNASVTHMPQQQCASCIDSALALVKLSLCVQPINQIIIGG